jgi:IclR family acetate operon transcriptional repressor
MNDLPKRLASDESAAPPQRVAGHVRSAWRALAVLEAVAESASGLTLREIARTLALPISSAHGLIVTLAEAGYLRRDTGTLRYRLGPRLGKLLQAFNVQTNVVAVAGPTMDRLRQATGGTVSLTVLQGDQIVFIDKRAASDRVQIVNPVGTRLPAHATGAGKAMLADLSEADRKRLYPREGLPQCTPFTLATRTALWEALTTAQQHGYAFDEQESELGVWAVAAAIRDVQGAPVGALSIFVPLFRVGRKQRQAWGKLVREAALEVSASLGYVGPAAPNGRRAASRHPTETAK